MISLVRAKQAIAAALLVVLVVLGALALRQLGAAVLSTSSGADATEIFNEVAPPPAALVDAIRWLPDPERDGRPMEPATRASITEAYARALAALDRAGRNDPDAPLDAYFSGPGLTAARDVAAGADLIRTATFHVRHDLRLDFYSDDGSVVAVGVPDVELVRVLDAGGGSGARSVRSSAEAWRFTMLLEDGNWRIQQLQTVDAAVPAAASPRRLAQPLIGVNATTVSGDDPTWRSFDAAEASADLDRAVGYGFDTVRVFVAGPEFGDVDVEAIATFLDLAADRQLRIVPVLFDGSADHAPDRWSDDRAYLERVVGGLHSHPAIVMWDVKNEPDLDDERSGGSLVVDAWLARTIETTRALDDRHPVTIGWSRAGAADRLADTVDVISFHHFDDADALGRALDDVAAVAARADDRQLVVSEFGAPEWVGPVRGSMPAAQARRVAELTVVLDDADVDGAMVWQLRDGSEPVETGVVAGKASTSYGIVRNDGTERPLAEVIRSGADAAPDAGAAERWRGRLPWLAPTAIGLLALLGLGWGIRRRSQAAGVA